MKRAALITMPSVISSQSNSGVAEDGSPAINAMRSVPDTPR